MENIIIISYINFKIIRKNKKVYTERVGKHKMNIEFLMIISSLITIKIKHFCIVFYILLSLTIYFQIQSILAYINQYNKKTVEQIINLKQEIRNLKTNVEIVKAVDNVPASGSNLDVLKRLSRLEKVVYGKQEEQE